MKKKLIGGIIIFTVSMMSLCGCQNTSSNDTQERSDDLYQVALLQSLMQGEYDGVISVGELKKYGDMGIGTFQGVNGEMIVLDGVVYQALWDGSVATPEDDETVPFSNVTWFDADITQDNLSATNVDNLKAVLTEIVEKNGRNQFFFAKMEGDFKQITVRSELSQKKPYVDLKTALSTDQREFTYDDISGTMVALYCPDYMKGLNTPGWHLHFISDDKTKGGHVLNISSFDGKTSLDLMSEYSMIIPNRDTFNEKALGEDLSDGIKKVESEVQNQ